MSTPSDDDGTPARPSVLLFTVPTPLPTAEEARTEIRRLARLAEFEYELERTGAAAHLKMRREVLDRIVSTEKHKLAEEGRDREPALEPVDGQELVEELVRDLTRYVSLDPD